MTADKDREALETLRNSQPPYLWPPYGSTRKPAPEKPLIRVPASLSSRFTPVFGHETVRASEGDLTRQHEGEPLGERIIVNGKVTDEDGEPVRGALLEIWQANASGRYRHKNDNH